MKYSIIELQSRQYQLAIGDSVVVNGTLGKPGEKLGMGRVLMIRDKDIELGQPEINQEAKFEVVTHGKSEKLRVATYKSKSRYRKVRGHRQAQTELKLISVDKKEAPKSKPSETKPTKPAASKTKKESPAKKTSKS